MKVAQINFTIDGSTGKIMKNIAQKSKSRGIIARMFTTEVYSVHGRKAKAIDEDVFYYGSFYENCIHNYLGKLLGRNGFFSYFGTKQLVRMLKKFSPDVVHLHNLHSHCIHLPTLFKYVKKNDIKLVWTLHDCWSMTGHCPNFDMIGCDKWKEGCYKCPQLRAYPKSYLDTTKQMYKKKKKIFTSVKDLILVTPSRWLKSIVEQSYLKEFPVKVINNGIDLNVFNYRESEFRQKWQLEGKSVVLGVAFGWGERKGLDVFIELSKRLGDDFRIVLVGTDKDVEGQLPANIISIRRTQNQIELAEIYSAADVFFNPTREENFPTVNIEALACGTPVITFKTGGSPEMLNEKCGVVIEKNDIDAAEREIKRVCKDRPIKREDCIERAAEFDMQEKFAEYVELYENCTHSSNSPL